jgi:hypothetical protein
MRSMLVLIVAVLALALPNEGVGECTTIQVACGNCLRDSCPTGGPNSASTGEVDDCGSPTLVCQMGAACGTGTDPLTGNPLCNIQTFYYTGTDCENRLTRIVSGHVCCKRDF